MTRPKLCNTEPSWQFTFYQQWSSLIESCNWYDFTLIKFEVEYDKVFNSVVLELGFLGFNLSISYCISVTEEAEAMKRNVDEFLRDIKK